MFRNNHKLTFPVTLIAALLVAGNAASMLDHNKITLIEQQGNNPQLTETVSPPSGNPWSWQVSGLSGFTAAPNLWFEYLDDGSGQPNELHTTANMHWSGIVEQNWVNGVDGSFTLTLTNGVDTDRNYSMSLSVRRLHADGYTIFEQQTSGGDMVGQAGAEGFAFTASGISGLSPAPSLTFNAMGAVLSCTTPNWTGDGTFTLTITDGTRPSSFVNGVSLSLRSLLADGYSVFEQQTSGSNMVASAGAVGFTFMASGISGLSPAPSLTFNAMGAVLNCTTPNWTGDGTFTLTITDGTRPSSFVNGVSLSLRRLVGSAFTVFENQTGGGGAIPGTDVDTYIFGIAPGSFSGISSDLDLGFTNRGAIYINDPGTVAWDEDGSFTMRINHGSRPYSDIAGLAMSLRRLVPDPLIIPNDGGGGSVMLQVAGDTGPWNWSGYVDGLPVSVLSALDTPNSSTLTISWGAGDLVDGESGDGNLIIERSDGSAPWSGVVLPTTIEVAGCCDLPGDFNDDSSVDIADLTAMVAFMFSGGPPAVCQDEADINADCSIDISDLTYRVAYMFGGGQAPVCGCIGT